jgi:hypothetical protein
LKLSFSIFHRARPQAAISATLALVTGNEVTKAVLYVTMPSNPIQLTSAASLPSRSGTVSMNR